MTHSPASKSVTPPSWRRFIPPVLAASLVAVLGVALLSPARNTTDGGPLIGKPAPTFVLNTLDGSSLNLASLKGRPVVLNFWASWCAPCREEAPLFRELSTRQTAGTGLAVVG
ncbi:MAG: thiol:disulfide interchange protein, partial [Deinococcus sp.]|nr:thiol:disulfide interchange protein [Deinococcus sp.]